MKNKVSTSVILDSRRQLKDGTYPVKLRVTFQRKQKYYPVINDKGEPFAFTESDYDKVRDPKARGSYKEDALSLNSIEKRATDAIEKLPVFSFETFEKRFLSGNSKHDVFGAFRRQIDLLKDEGRAGTASSYECAYRSLSDFASSKTLLFSDVSVDFLKKYEKWMVESGKSLTTVGMYLRALRAIYNDAIASGDAYSELYPFGKREYQIPAGQNIKKALVIDDIEKIFSYEPAHDGEAKARDLFIFSYLCNGINIKDIARLKYSNINGGQITFIRAKTERTSRQNLKPVVVVLTDEAQKIIDRWGIKPKSSDGYVFPILTKGLTPEEELAKVRYATKAINKYIKRIALAVGIDSNVSTYTARHSYSTILKRSGVSIEYISESLGHNNLKTTESYLDSFEDDVKRQYAAHLTAFTKKK
ncbi:site-specific integrase [Pontibacter sp. JH31]|uniref:Site-specific integrase n=1 Tax=Pontibacter aquaedesilientis TaxID=2766980 RepID=A0ABR7XM44_9BACT|nr:site-specific integrase [Pontibacter aquaedesilientis]MBD1399046.1 site-specific integrase [Pontibacter aquaedesilientis]